MPCRRSLIAASLWTGAVIVGVGGGCGPGGTIKKNPGLSEAHEALRPDPVFDGDPANQAVYGVDISHWEGPVSQSEVDCFWESGVRHVISGTQVEEIVRQQLAMAVSRGLTVDAYVYLYWDQDIGEQVREAFRRSAGFPIGRMWLDVEEDPRGLDADTLVDLIREGLAACDAEGTAICGIYTGPGFWGTYMNETRAFADRPLWYAWYNRKATLSVWDAERFGGWVEPTGKQWAEEALCGVGVDKNVIQTATAPTVVVDRTLPPDDGAVPPALERLYPTDGHRVRIGYVKLMAAPVARATQYQLALEVWRRGAYEPYYTWTLSEAFLKTNPLILESPYRFRARARNAHGWGAWSSWSHFYFGYDPAAEIPGAAEQPPATTATITAPPVQPAPAPDANPAPPDDAPTGLTPDGETLAGASVTLSCSPVDGAAGYELAVENLTQSGAFSPYAKWSIKEASKTFFPQLRGVTYRWRARARLDGVLAGWSAWATFDVE